MKTSKDEDIASSLSVFSHWLIILALKDLCHILNLKFYMFLQFPLGFYIFTSTEQGFLEHEVKLFQLSHGHIDPQSHL